MNLLRLVPVILSVLVLGAHFLRALDLILFAACLALPVLLVVRRPWVPRLFQVVLVLGALEWVRTLVAVARFREAHGAPFTRMALILGGVAAVTALSALVFRSEGLRERYGMGTRIARNPSSETLGVK